MGLIAINTFTFDIFFGVIKIFPFMYCLGRLPHQVCFSLKVMCRNNKDNYYKIPHNGSASFMTILTGSFGVFRNIDKAI